MKMLLASRVIKGSRTMNQMTKRMYGVAQEKEGWKDLLKNVAESKKQATFASLEDRSVLVCEGPDIVSLLQNTTTNDMRFITALSEEAPHPFDMQSPEKIARQDLLYTCFLSNKGRFLFDAFLFVDRSAPDSPLGHPTRVFIDCEASSSEELLDHLQMRIIRKKVKVCFSFFFSLIHRKLKRRG